MEDKKLTELLKTLVNEAAVPGIDTTDKVTKQSKKHNDEYQKEVKSKMKDLEKDTIKGEEDDNTDVKFTADDHQKEYHDEMETMNGQEMIDYSQEPSERFKERAEMSLKGDSKMGNEVKTGEWNPETGEGNGNTESTWGASDDKFGEKLVDRIKSSNKKRNDATQSITQFGDDIEMGSPAKISNRKLGIKENENKAMKRLKFKTPFNGEKTAIKVIPEQYKKDDLVFEMTDGNETYKIRWEGTITEGEAVVLSSENASIIAENKAKAMKLMNFNSNDTLGRMRSTERLAENTKFRDMMSKAKNLLNESEDKETE